MNAARSPAIRRSADARRRPRLLGLRDLGTAHRHRAACSSRSSARSRYPANSDYFPWSTRTRARRASSRAPATRSRTLPRRPSFPSSRSWTADTPHPHRRAGLARRKSGRRAAGRRRGGRRHLRRRRVAGRGDQHHGLGVPGALGLRRGSSDAAVDRASGWTPSRTSYGSTTPSSTRPAGAIACSPARVEMLRAARDRGPRALALSAASCPRRGRPCDAMWLVELTGRELASADAGRVTVKATSAFSPR